MASKEIFLCSLPFFIQLRDKCVYVIWFYIIRFIYPLWKWLKKPCLKWHKRIAYGFDCILKRRNLECLKKDCKNYDSAPLPFLAGVSHHSDTTAQHRPWWIECQHESSSLKKLRDFSDNFNSRIEVSSHECRQINLLRHQDLKE